MFDVTISGEKKVVLVKDLQRHPVRGDIQHVDFYEVSMDRPVDTTVPVVLEGEDARESDGGIVGLVVRELNISCLPTDIPESIAVDVSQLVIGDTLTVADLKVDQGITVNHDPDEVIVTVTAPAKADEAEAEATEGEDAEAEAEAETEAEE